MPGGIGCAGAGRIFEIHAPTSLRTAASSCAVDGPRCTRPGCRRISSASQVRDLLHVFDAIRCYVATTDHLDVAKREELFAHLEKRLGIRMVYERLPWRHSDREFFVANNRKAGEMFALETADGPRKKESTK